MGKINWVWVIKQPKIYLASFSTMLGFCSYEEYGSPFREMYQFSFSHTCCIDFLMIGCSLDILFVAVNPLSVLYFRHHSSALNKVISQNYRFRTLIRKEYTSSDRTSESLLVSDHTSARNLFIEGARMFLLTIYKILSSTRSMHSLNAWIKNLCNHFDIWSDYLLQNGSIFFFNIIFSVPIKSLRVG